MPAKSQTQQRLFGMVDACQKGELENPSKEVEKIAKSMPNKEVKKFAKTKHKGLPEKVGENKLRLTQEQFVRLVEESVKRVINEAESEGWRVESTEAQDAYNFAVNYFGEEALNSAIVGCLGDETLAQCLAYIFRQYDFKEWKSKYEDTEDGIEDEL
jgi:16S rRNA C967 or C1407 C5-methylase (RsmB/RsmF family)